MESHILQWKEILESFEFFDQTRKYIRRPRVAEVCCGHGLIGVLYAMLEESVDEVLLTDARIPPSQAKVISAASALAPWIDGKLTVADKEITETHALVNPDTSIVSSHGCGALTDQAIDLGISTRGSVAVMPCCCHPRSPDAPEVLYRELGIKDGVDVYRTYKLHAAGRRVLWRYIPEAITPMNRILIGAARCPPLQLSPNNSKRCVLKTPDRWVCHIFHVCVDISISRFPGRHIFLTERFYRCPHNLGDR